MMGLLMPRWGGRFDLLGLPFADGSLFFFVFSSSRNLVFYSML